MAPFSSIRPSLTLALLLAFSLVSYVVSYPMIVELSEQDEKCFKFNIPRDDDGHMVFVAIPSTLSPGVEEWYVRQTYELTKGRTDVDTGLPRKFGDQPSEEMLKELDDFMAESGRRSGVTLRVTKPHSPRPLRQQQLSWFNPAVMNHVEKFQRNRNSPNNYNKLEGYSICLQNESQDQVHVAFDLVLVSEAPPADEEEGVVEKRHLSPLEQELASSIMSAHNILSEMRYMEKREARMRQTTDSIHSRIRYFTYLSVGVLVVVTYVQVTYLKRYFKKKKLM